jgi:hypothetical protein
MEVVFKRASTKTIGGPMKHLRQGARVLAQFADDPLS